MSNFMGPMAPPQAAPTQPPQLDIRTNPNQRERFREFMRQNTRPNLAVPAMQPPMMPQAPMPMAPQAPRPPIPMAIRPNAPMPAQPAPMPYGANIDVFSPQYMNQPRPMYLEDGGSVPPRRAEIKGQDHMLSYITPDEADILKALGGSGEAGPMGIPSFPGGYGGEGMGGFGDAGVGNDSGGGPAGSGGASGSGDHSGGEGSASGANADSSGSDNSDRGGGQDRTGMQDTLDAYNALSDDQKAADFAKAAQAGKDSRDRAARDLVARTFALDSKGNPVGAPNSQTGFATTGNPSQGQINDALEAAKSLGMDISGSQTATDLGLNDAPTNAVEAVSSKSSSTKNVLAPDLLAELAQFQYSPPTPSNVNLTVNPSTGLSSYSATDQPTALGISPGRSMAQFGDISMAGKLTDPLSDMFGYEMASSPEEAALAASVSPTQDTKASSGMPTANDLLGLSSRPSTQTVDDPMAVARAMDQISPKGLLDAGLVNAAADFISDIFGLTPDPEAVRSDYENRAYSSLGMSPGTASAVLGTQTATGPVTGAIGGPRGFLGSLAFGPYSPGAAGMTGMTPDGKSTGAITGDQLADLATRNRSGILGGISGFFNDMTRSAASKSNVAVVNPATGQIVGAIDGKGRYTGDSRFNPNPRDNFNDRGGNEPYIPPYIPPVVEPVVDDGVPNVFGGMGDDNPYQPLVQNYTGDGREQYAGTLRMPVGYGDPRTGYIAPQAFITTGFAPPPRGPIPIGFFEGGGEVLDQAAGRFLEALTAA